jgi:glycosyltransferase involved in cell wall biosynthesis
VGVASDGAALKILHIDPEINWGGGESQVIGLASYLAARGHRNHLLCHPRGALWEAAQRAGIEVFPLSLRNEVDLRPVFSLRRLIRGERYDIVHFHTKRAHALSLWLGRIHSELRYVVTRRMDYPLRRGRYVDFLYNRRVDGVIAISRKIAELLVQAGVRAERIRLIHSGIDPAPFKMSESQGTSQGPTVVGTVAVLEKRKGHRFLLEAAAALKRQGHRVKYRWAGEGSERQALERQILASGLQGEVEFAGFVGAVPGFLSAIDIFVLPSLYEGLGVSVLEAMAAGKPVVATRAGGLPEIVDDGVTGVLVPPGDAQALARALASLVSNPTLARQMGSKGRERVLRGFTMEKMAQGNEDYYYEILEAHRGELRGPTRKEAERVGVQK